jgi:hypothetical protein
MLTSEVQAGDELIISCEPADAVITKVTNHYVFIQWPWRARDQSSRAKWDGTLALPRIEASHEWANTPWRVDPSPEELEVGMSCMVGIPRTTVLVRRVYEYDPPRSLGWLPKPTAGVGVVEVGSRQEDEEAGYLVYLDGAEPIVFERA